MRAYKYIIGFVIVVVVLNSCMKDLYMHKQRKYYKKAIVHQPFDAVIVPGYPFKGRGYEAILKMRILWAKYLYDNGITKNFIFSGSAVYTPYIESEILKLMAIEVGIDTSVIFLEKEAEHTTENVYNSLKIAKKKAWKNIALATDNMQISIVKRYIKKNKINIKYLAVDILIIDSLDKVLPEIIINDSLAFVKNFKPITETQTFKYRWRGTQGKNIIFCRDSIE